MAERTNEISRPEESKGWAWLRENRPDKVAWIYYLGSRDIEEKKISDVAFGERGFILNVGTHENEDRPCAVTETYWTVTYVVSETSPCWTARINVCTIPKHAEEIYRGGGLEVYTFYCDD